MENIAQWKYFSPTWKVPDGKKNIREGVDKGMDVREN